MKIAVRILSLIVLISSTSLFAQDNIFNGVWQGKLAVSGQELRIVFHITQTEDGKYTASMDSPDQGAKGIPVNSVEINNTEITLNLISIGGLFTGELQDDKQTIKGNWTQGGYTFPLVLRINETAPAPVRPQEPRAPFPYHEQEIKITNPEQGNTIAGTFTFPKGAGSYPAVILITGSGAQDRDETIFGHKPFWVLADYLTCKGFAVFRYDDRGVNSSTGNLSVSTIEDLSTDVLAAVNYLKKQSAVNPQKIGLIGHSEGGLTASLAAAENTDIAFVVLMAAPGIIGSEIICDQVGDITRLQGASEEEVRQNMNLQRKILDIVKQEKDSRIAMKKLKDVVHADKHAQIKILLSPKYRSLISFDPALVLINVKCPVLALIGSKDIQVKAGKNLDAISKILKAGGNTDFQTKEILGVNHLFQTAETGAVSEYGRIEETISSRVLEVISDWLKNKTGI